MSIVSLDIGPNTAAPRLQCAPRAVAFAVALVASWSLGGCAFIPEADLTATPTVAPRSDCAIAATDTATQSVPTDPVDALNASLLRVRNTPAFISPIAPDVVDLDALNREAKLLADKARERTVAKAMKRDVSVDLEANALEARLLDLIPWSGDVDMYFPPALEQLDTIRSNGLALIKLVADKSVRLNTLLPNNSKKTQTPIAPIPGTLLVATEPTNARFGTAIAGEDVHIATFSRSDEFGIFRNLTNLAAFRTFHLLSLLSAAHLNEMLRATNPPRAIELDTEVRVFNTTRFLSSYFDAYFRGGQFVQVNVDEAALRATLWTKVQSKLAGVGVQKLDTDQIEKLLKPEFDALCAGTDDKSACSSIQLGKTSFVTRAGLSVQFSGISFTIDTGKQLGLSHTYPQVSEFGPQMVRVLVEAIFDANGVHPKGAQNSTACQEGLFNPDECVKPSDAADPQLAQIDMISAGTEALTSTATGALIRGINMASLNNETVAQVLETLAGVNARKISERVLYVASRGQNCPLTPVALRVK